MSLEPIETAPRDGRLVLLYPQRVVARWDRGDQNWIIIEVPLKENRQIAHDWRKRPSMWFCVYANAWGDEPSHWMPLPKEMWDGPAGEDYPPDSGGPDQEFHLRSSEGSGSG